MSIGSRIAILHDAMTPQNGAGHHVRCKALRDELVSRGALVDMIAWWGGKWATNAADEAEFDALVLDTKRDVPMGLLDELRSGGVLVATIDDSSEKADHCDLVFNGYDDVILRREFADDPSPPKNDVPVVLVAMGGADAGGWRAAYVAQALGGISRPLAWTILDGKWEAGAARGLMLECDVAVASMGMTAYELCACGRPSVLISRTEEHLRAATTLWGQGCASSLGLAADVTDGDIVQTVRWLLGDELTRRRMGKVGRSLIDGQGAERVASKIMGALA